jgi:hypothetical protein
MKHAGRRLWIGRRVLAREGDEGLEKGHEDANGTMSAREIDYK